MRKVVFVILVSFLLATLAFVHKGNVPAVEANSPIYQGDLVLNGNNVTIIEGTFDINGSIIIEENATLILRNAVLNFLRVESYQSNMTLENPANGNPRLIVENATIATDNAYYQRAHFYGNSSASINKLTTIGKISLHLYDSSVASISNSTAYFIDFQGDSSADISNSVFSKGSLTYDSSTLNIFNCTLDYLYVGETSSVDMSNCTIYRDVLSEAVSANCSINELGPGFAGYWDFKLNCSVQIAPGGSACNFTLTDTEVGGWSFDFAGSSNVTISNSELYDIRPDGSSVVWVYDSSFSNLVNSRGSSSTHIYNSTIDNLQCRGSPRVWLMNSTASYVYATDFSVLIMMDSTLSSMQVDVNPEVTMSNCTITSRVQISIQSGNYSVTELKPSLVSFWNFELNCSVSVAPTGWAPNVTLIDTQVEGWGFLSQGKSNATIFNSELWALWSYNQATVDVYNSVINTNSWGYGSSRCHLYNTTTQGVFPYQNSKVWLVNSTSSNYNIHDQSEVYVYWYLDVHAVDSGSTDVPSANVTASYPNATKAESRLTNTIGRVKLTLMEKMMNTAGSYPIGNYTVTAKYETHEGHESVNMTGNRQIIIQLPFIIPEFPTALILPLFMIATLLAVTIYRRKQTRIFTDAL